MSEDNNTFTQLKKKHEQLLHAKKRDAESCKVIFTLPPDIQSEISSFGEVSGIRSSLSSICNSTKTELRIAIPYLSAKGLVEITEMIGDATKTPAAIRLIFRDRTEEIEKEFSSTFTNEIATKKIQIRYRNNFKGSGLHGKVAICDDEKALVMSANWTESSMRWNDEVGVEISYKAAIESLTKWFDTLWELIGDGGDINYEQ